MTILLTIEIEGGNLGPFDLYSNTDEYTDPFATNITKAALEAGYTSTSVPPDTTTVQVKSVGNCSNSIDIVLQNIIVPCNGTSDSGGFGLKDLSVDLDPAGGVITFLFDPQGAADKMEFYHGLPQDDGINKVATTSQSAPGQFGGNYGPFDDEYGTPPAPIIFPNNPTTDVDQFIGTFKGTVPTRQSEYTNDTGCTIPSMTIGSVTYDQVIWWRYDAADYLANPIVTIRITGSGDNTLWNLVRICNVCTTTTTTTATPTTTTTTSSSTSTSTSTTTSTTTTAPMTWTYNVQLISCQDCTVIGSGIFANGQELIVGEYYLNNFGTLKILILGLFSLEPGSAASNILTSSGATICEEIICPTPTTTTTSSTSTSSSTTTTTTTVGVTNYMTGVVINDSEDIGKTFYGPSYNFTSNTVAGDWNYQSGVMTIEQPSKFETFELLPGNPASPSDNDILMMHQYIQSYLPNDILFDPTLGNKMWYLISLVEYTSEQLATILADATLIPNLQLIAGNPSKWEGTFLFDISLTQSNYVYLIWDYRKTITTTTTTAIPTTTTTTTTAPATFNFVVRTTSQAVLSPAANITIHYSLDGGNSFTQYGPTLDPSTGYPNYNLTAGLTLPSGTNVRVGIMDSSNGNVRFGTGQNSGNFITNCGLANTFEVTTSNSDTNVYLNVAVSGGALVSC